MNTPQRFRLLPAAIVLALSSFIALPVAAQELGSTSMRTQREKRMKEQGRTSEKQAKQAAEYPDAIRQEPNERASAKGMKQLQSLAKQYEAGEYAAVMNDAAAFANTASNNYEKAYAYQLAASAAAETEQWAKGVEYAKAAVEANGLDNNNHFRVMSNLASMQAQQEQYPQALATIERFLAETKSTDSRYLSMRASLLANAGRNDEATAAFKQLLAQNPGDKRVLMNVVSSLQQSDKFAEANQLLQDARKRGMLTEAREYRSLYSGLLGAEDWKGAAEVIEEGAMKGLLPKDKDLAKAWSVTGNRAYFADDLDAAAKYYARAAEISDDGEDYLNLAKVYDFQNKQAESRAAAQKALAKGVGNKAEATRLSNKK